MAVTRTSKSGQPVMGTTLEVEVIDERRPEKGEFWVSGTVVGKLYGKGGSADLVGLIVEVTDDLGLTGRIRVGPDDWREVRA